MTDQELFDKVVTHLFTQGVKATGRWTWPELAGPCMYRTPEGLKCAAGCLIADEHYFKLLEGMACVATPVSYALLASGVTEEQIPLVRSLQFVHDDFDVPRWPAGLALVAKRYSLEWNHDAP